MAPRSEHDRLRFRRRAAGLSQRELARRSGVKQPLIAAAESGTRCLSAQARRRLEESLQPRPLALLRSAREEVLALAEARGCEVVGVFGSAARGTDDSSSDIDLLVRFPPEADILTLLALEEELSDLLTVPVDVVSVGSGSQALVSSALDEAVPL